MSFYAQHVTTANPTEEEVEQAFADLLIAVTRMALQRRETLYGTLRSVIPQTTYWDMWGDAYLRDAVAGETITNLMLRLTAVTEEPLPEQEPEPEIPGQPDTEPSEPEVPVDPEPEPVDPEA